MAKLQKGVNDLYTWCDQNGEWGQQLLQEWVGLDDYGNSISMSGISRSNHKKVKWKCKEGHEWLAQIANRTANRRGCPYCSGRRASNKNSLETWCQNNGVRGQQLKQEWTGLDENGNTIEIYEISYASHKKVQWKCNKGHKWLSRINNRTVKGLGRDCMYCFSNHIVREDNSLYNWCKDNEEFGKQLMQEWLGLDENGNLIETHEVSYASAKKVHWKCIKGHIWTAQILSRTCRKTSCPYCNPIGTSFPEQFIYHSLRQIFPNIIHRGRYKGYEYDITIPELRLCIEYSGICWHKDKLDRDLEKQSLCEKKGVNFLQIYAHYGEVQDANGIEVDGIYTKNQIIYKVSYSKDIHRVQLIRIVEFILKHYAPQHSISEINFAQAESDAYAIMQGNT